MTETALTPPRTPNMARWLAEARSLAGLALLTIGFQSLIAKPFYIPSESMMPTLLVGDQLVVAKWPYGWSYASPIFHLLPFMRGRLFGRLPQRGDIVILTPPDPARPGEDLIKRVIGLPGDTVAMVGGHLWLNGRRVATRDMGYRLMAIDGHFHCDANDPDPERAFPGFVGARVNDAHRKAACRLHVIRETLPNGRSYDTLDFGRTEADDFPAYTVRPGHVFVMGDNRDDSADSRVPIGLNGLGGAVPFEDIGGRAEFVTVSLNGNATWNPVSWLRGFRSDRAAVSLHPSVGP